MIFRTLYPASRKLLLDSVSELDIFLIWCKSFKALNKNFKSPILIVGSDNMSEDSANIGRVNGHYVFRDFRLGESYGCIQFAEIMTGLSTDDVIQYLCEAFGLRVKSVLSPKIKAKTLSQADLNKAASTEKKPIFIDVKYAPWTLRSLTFWVKAGWMPHMLDKAKIRPIERFWMSYDEYSRQEYDSSKLGPMSFSYDFYEVDGVFRRKIYSPYAEREFKWKNNSSKSVIQGINTIDFHVPKLYLTSSLKDCGPFWSILGHPCAVAPNSESTTLSPAQVRMLRQISDEQIIWFDNDLVGINNAKKYSNLYGFKYQYNPISSPKDPSDYWTVRGGREFNKLIL